MPSSPAISLLPEPLKECKVFQEETFTLGPKGSGRLLCAYGEFFHFTNRPTGASSASWERRIEHAPENKILRLSGLQFLNHKGVWSRDTTSLYIDEHINTRITEDIGFNLPRNLNAFGSPYYIDILEYQLPEKEVDPWKVRTSILTGIKRGYDEYELKDKQPTVDHDAIGMARVVVLTVDCKATTPETFNKIVGMAREIITYPAPNLARQIERLGTHFSNQRVDNNSRLGKGP